MSPIPRWSIAALVLGCTSVEPKEDSVDPGLDGVADVDTDTDTDTDTDVDTDTDTDVDTDVSTGSTGDTGPTTPEPLEWVDELAVTSWSYWLRVGGTDAGWVLATTAFTAGAEFGDPATLVLGEQSDAVTVDLQPGAVLGDSEVIEPVLPENELVVTDVVTVSDGTVRLLTTDYGAEPFTTDDPFPNTSNTLTEAQLRSVSTTGATDLWSIRPLDLDSAVLGGDVAVHPGGDLTVTATFSGGAVLPDGTVLDNADGVGAIVRTGDDGVVDWFHQFPGGFPRAVADGDDVVLLFDTLGPVDLGGHSLPAPADRSGVAVARITASGDVLWLRGFDGMAFASRPLPGPAVTATGDVAVAVWGELTPLGFATPPTLSGEQHLVALDATGEPAWVWSSPDPSGGPDGLVVDDHDTLWSFVRECAAAGTTFSPSLEPAWTSAPCTDEPHLVLLGHDAATGTLRFARDVPVAPFTGPYGTIGSPHVLGIDDVAMSADGKVAAVARFGRDLRARALLFE